MDEATPRVTLQYLQNFQGRTVRILGRVVQLRGDEADIDAFCNATNYGRHPFLFSVIHTKLGSKCTTRRSVTRDDDLAPRKTRKR